MRVKIYFFIYFIYILIVFKITISHTIAFLLIAAVVALTAGAEDRWSWSSSNKSGRSVNRPREEHRQQERLEDL